MTTNDFDPTTNRIPFGLLSEDEQTALIHWPHGCEIWWEDKENNWGFIVEPQWQHNCIYRGKPKPPVVTSTWTPIYSNGCTGFAYDSPNEAKVGVIGVGMVGVLRLDITDGVPKATVVGKDNQ